MGENVIQSIGQAESGVRAVYQMAQNHLFKAGDVNSAPQFEKVVEKNARSEKTDEKPAQPAQQTLLPVTSGNTFLRFDVDEKTNDITVYVMDRASRSVLRTIPPSVVNKLKAGDLLRLLA